MDRLPLDLFYLICELLDGVSADSLCHTCQRFYNRRQDVNKRMSDLWVRKMNLLIRGKGCNGTDFTFHLIRWGIYYDQWETEFETLGIDPRVMKARNLSQLLRVMIGKYSNYSYSCFANRGLSQITIRSRRMSIFLKSIIGEASEVHILALCLKIVGYKYTNVVKFHFRIRTLIKLKRLKNLNNRYACLVKYRKEFPELFYGRLMGISPPPGLIYEVINWELTRLSYFKSQQETIDRLFPYLKNPVYERKIKFLFPMLIYPS